MPESVTGSAESATLTADRVFREYAPGSTTWRGGCSATTRTPRT